jgi:hypothetical protein
MHYNGDYAGLGGTAIAFSCTIVQTATFSKNPVDAPGANVLRRYNQAQEICAMREALIIGLLYAAVGALVTALAAKYAGPLFWDIIEWGAGAIIVGCAVSLWLSFSSATTGRPFLLPAALINLGLCLVALGFVWHFSLTAPVQSASKVQTVRKAFSETQSIKTLPPFLGGNDTLRLDNVATLHLYVPYSDNSITLVLDASPVRLPDQNNDGVAIQGAHTFTHDTKDEIAFDVGVNKRREITVGDRTFVVTLLEVRHLATPDVAKPLEFVFGISEK